jgi:integrase
MARRSINDSSSRIFRRVCEKAGLPDHLTPHSMRHTFACLHIGQDCNPKWLQQQMGHSSINVTLDTYAKWWNLEDHAAADALGALVGSDVAAKAL